MKCQEPCSEQATVKLIWGYERHDPPNPHYRKVCNKHLSEIAGRVERTLGHYLIIKDLSLDQK